MSAWLEHPDWWMGLALACSAIALCTWSAAHRTRVCGRRLLGARGIASSCGRWGDALLVIALVCLAVGLVGPRIGRDRVAPTAGGVDVVLLFDVSQSMDAEDAAPSRLRRAREQAGTLLDRLAEGDRIALAGFAGRGVLFTPLTPDRDAIAAMLPHLDTRLIRPGGSDLAAGIEAALSVFDETSTRPRVVVIWSDGEISRPDGAVGESAAARAHARVIALGIGSEDGAPVPDRGAPLRDASGELVVSRRFLGPLERLAEATGGSVLPADRFGHIAVERLATEVDRDSSSPDAREDAQAIGTANAPRIRLLPVALAWPFAAIAFVLLLAETGWTSRATIHRKPRRANPRLRVGGARRAWLAVFLAVGLSLRAGATDGTESAQALAARLSRGVERAGAGDTSGAAEDFEAVSVLAADPVIVALAEYDLGVLDLARGDLEGARDHFLAALVYAPNDGSARFNAEWTLRAIAASEPPDGDRPASEPTRTAAADVERPSEPATRAGDPRSDEGRREEGPADDARSIEEAAEADPTAALVASGPGSAELPIAAMSAEERRRWLDRLVDDPSRSMQQRAVTDHDTPRPRRSLITW